MTLGFGLVGCGGMGRELGLAVTEHVAEARVVAAFDPYRPNLERFCQEAGAAPAATLEELLSRADVQAVIIASPNDAHCGQTLAAAAAGKHVFCEKPMALSVADCDRMIEACDRAGLKLMVGHSMRLYPLPRRLLEVARSGELGTPLYGFASYLFSGFKDRDSGIWHLDRDRSGGLFFHMAIHHIDLFLAIFGRAARVGYAGARYGRQVRDFDDIGTVTVEFESGGTGVLSTSSISPVSWREIVLLFSDGFARMDNPWGGLQYGADEQHLTKVEPGDLLGPGAVEAELRSFARWVLHDEPPVFTGAEGRAAVAVAEAAQRAKETGSAITVES
jgi:predicted dehydrogenase